MLSGQNDMMGELGGSLANIGGAIATMTESGKQTASVSSKLGDPSVDSGARRVQALVASGSSIKVTTSAAEGNPGRAPRWAQLSAATAEA